MVVDRYTAAAVDAVGGIRWVAAAVEWLTNITGMVTLML